MLRRPFGPTRQAVPVIGQGTWQLRRPDHAEAALRQGLELGLTHIDTAELYTGSEAVVARAVAGRRDDVFLVSKVLPRHATYQGTLEACRASLARLRTDRLDVYLLHWMESFVDMGECMRALGELADAGATRWIGVSNFEVAELQEAQRALGDRHRIACNQVYYDLEHRHIENQMIPFCAQNQIAVVGYSPFGSGRFPRPASPGGQALARVAARHRATPHQVVLKFLSRDPNVFLIPKAETIEHVRTNAASLDLDLLEQDLQEIESAFPRTASTEVPSL